MCKLVMPCTHICLTSHSFTQFLSDIHTHMSMRLVHFLYTYIHVSVSHLCHLLLSCQRKIRLFLLSPLLLKFYIVQNKKKILKYSLPKLMNIYIIPYDQKYDLVDKPRALEKNTILKKKYVII